MGEYLTEEMSRIVARLKMGCGRIVGRCLECDKGCIEREDEMV